MAALAARRVPAASAVSSSSQVTARKFPAWSDAGPHAVAATKIESTSANLAHVIVIHLHVLHYLPDGDRGNRLRLTPIAVFN
jgi:hypothetical protein